MSEGFDDIIRKKLQAYKSEQGISWEDFKSKLDSELGPVDDEANISELDLMVQQKLKNYTVPFEATHWAILRDRLRQQVKRLENLYISKVFEVLTVLLLLFHFGQFVQVGTNKATKGRNLANQLIIDQKATQTNSIQTAGETIFDLADQQKNISTQNISISDQTEISSQSSNELIYSDNLNDEVLEGDIVEYKSTSSLIEEYPFPDFLRIREFTPVNSHCKMDQLASIDAIDTKLVYSDELDPIIIPVASDNSTSPKSKLAMYLNLDNTLVNTPPDQIYANIGEVLFNSFDYGAGINYQKELSQRFEGGIGLGYSTISYNPQRVEEVFIDENSGGTYSVHLNNIFFNVINLPTFVNYHFIKKDNWSMFVNLGLSANFIAEAEYRTEFEALRPTSIPPSFQDVNSGAPPTEAGPRLFEKSFNNGLFEGGSLSDNLYFSANIGLGISKNVSRDISMFSSLNYRNHILDQGVGPNNDKLSSLSAQIGLQYNLN